MEGDFKVTDYKLGGLLKYLWQKAKSFLSADINPLSFYYMGMLVVGANLLFSSSDSNGLAELYLYYGISMLIVGFCWELGEKLWLRGKDSLTFSLLAAVSSSALVGAISFSISESLVNNATSLNPDYFDNSVRIIASAIAPFVLVHVLALMVAIWYVAKYISLCFAAAFVDIPKMYILNLFGKKNIKARFRVGLLDLTRMFSSMMLLIFVYSSSGYLSKYSDNISYITKSLVLVVDFFPAGNCLENPEDKWVAFLDEGKIAVFSDLSLGFDVAECSI